MYFLSLKKSDLGHNAMAALVSQGMSEMNWLAEKMGAKMSTLASPAGVGDVMLTCFVNKSRNRTVGLRLGRGESLEEILESMDEVWQSSYTFVCKTPLQKESAVCFLIHFFPVQIFLYTYHSQ